MGLKPAEIAMRKFSRSVLGADPSEVRQFLIEAAASLERVNGELARVVLDRTTLQGILKQTNAQVETLRQQLAEAQEKLATYREQESLMAHVVLNAEKISEELTRDSRAQAERAVADASALAQETLQTARNSAADLLRATRARAQEAVEAADRAAAARLAEARMEAEQIVTEARRAAADAQQAAQAEVEQFIARLEAFLASREELARNLDVVAKHQADALEVVARMHAEVEHDVLPALRDLMRTLLERDVGARAESVAPAAPAPPRPEAAPAESAVLAGAPEEPAQPAAGDGEDRRPGARDVAGEIVVSPVHSYLQATKLVTAVSKTAGVKAARLRSYSRGTITIDVVTEAGTVANLSLHLINGLALSIVEATDRRLVLRIGERASAPLAGGEGVPLTC